MEKLGEKVRFYRRKKGLTRKQLGNGLCDESTIYRLEKNKQLPRLDILQELSGRLDISLHVLLYPHDEEFDRIKALCKEFTYYEDYLALELVLEEFHYIISNREATCPSKKIMQKYYNLYRAFMIFKWEVNLTEAKQILESLIINECCRNELDVDILSLLGILHLELKQFNESHQLLEKAFQLLETLPRLEDICLYPRVGYHFSLILYYKKEYDTALDLCYSLLYYLKSKQLSYYLGEIYYLIGKILTEQHSYQDSFSYFQHALVSFFLEEKHERMRIVEEDYDKLFEFLQKQNS